MRLIFVPSRLPDPLVHKHDIDVGGSIVHTKYHTAPPYPDPLIDYLIFYGPANIPIDVMQAQWCVNVVKTQQISFAAIETWVADNCVEPVLVQRADSARQSNMGGGFFFYFCDGKYVRNQFSSWIDSYYAAERAFHTFELSLNSDVTAAEIVEWIAINTPSGRLIQVHDARAIAAIKDDQEAVAFRLRWSDSETPA